MNLDNFPVTPYWERQSDGLCAEPFNALSNIAFFIAAYLVYRLARKEGRWEGWVMAGLLFAVGVGSSLYHTARSPYTLILDVAPIAIFILLGMFLMLRWLVNGSGRSITLIAIFLVIQALMPRGALNGSVPYIVTLGALSLITVGAFYKRSDEAFTLFVSCLVFGWAIMARSLDMTFTAAFPMGTHWLWHIFAAASAYLAVRFVIQTKTNCP